MPDGLRASPCFAARQALLDGAHEMGLTAWDDLRSCHCNTSADGLWADWPWLNCWAPGVLYSMCVGPCLRIIKALKGPAIDSGCQEMLQPCTVDGNHPPVLPQRGTSGRKTGCADRGDAHVMERLDWPVIHVGRRNPGQLCYLQRAPALWEGGACQ